MKSKRMASTKLTASRLPALFAACLIAHLASQASAAEPSAKPVFLYSRHFNAQGEGRYLADGTYKEVLTRLRDTFEVRVHSEAPTDKSLAGVAVVLISNPSDKAVGDNQPPPHVGPTDIAALTRFVERGGGLIVMGNQENHNLEIEDTNKLLARFGLGFTNLYTDAKQLVIAKDTPIIGGLRWAYYTGNLATVDAKHPAKPRSLVPNDLNRKPLKGTRDQAGPLLAVAEPGRGRVVIVTDAGWITDASLSGAGVGDVAIKEQDNFEIFRRLATWAAAGAAKR